MTYLWLGLLWLLWGAGLLGDSFARSLAVSLSNFVGAYALWWGAARSPTILRGALSGLAVGLLVLGVGDLLYTYNLASGLDTRALREGIYLVGAVLLLLMGGLLPFRMERQGLYPLGFAQRLALLAGLGGVLLSALATLIRPLSLLELIYAGVAFSLTLLFVQQTPVLAGGRIGRYLRGVVWALVLGSLARLVYILGGAPPALWSVVAYDVLWMLAMSVLLLGVIKAPKNP
ncbi:hypothetical protein [Meiothermus taiwanensis]|jgi:hypothetical protein|uniref:Uncharacterized protein n=2 Tax=Meiothermus taiwanensis TaxID=172827 RepID=A0A399DZG0_9DEIN|nr:hypothetical protein [Meiothermus taiwanensis]AWR86191.1 hypothetical protein Mtai_v1c09470 [Meiothermus taiwanensis WR-220]KIQ55895.1 hypothetical protein SY28_01385 [Meiothermus taiwanensis]KZK16819.1 hypothetical protein A3962_14165 [Meiothermus taiwanensis]RIH75302.1 hypothetical protein Mcate_02314 [Meiothermus taiwanensis]